MFERAKSSNSVVRRDDGAITDSQHAKIRMVHSECLVFSIFHEKADDCLTNLQRRTSHHFAEQAL